MQSFTDFKYANPESTIGPEAYKRRMAKQKKKKVGLSSVTNPEERDDSGNSRLSSILRKR